MEAPVPTKDISEASAVKTSEEGPSTNNTSDNGNDDAMKSYRMNDDAFSSSSSSASSGTSSNEDGEDSEPPKRGFTSEFDKAMQSGQPSRGNFFSEEENMVSQSTGATYPQHSMTVATVPPPPPPHHPPSKKASSGKTGLKMEIQDEDPLSSGVLPDALMTMRQKIESMTLFDSDMLKLANEDTDDPIQAETRESLKRSSQQSISAAVLVSLAHKRYERRRLAAMEIEKVVRALVSQNDLERVRAILLLLSDDYVRSASEDARKGGVVALAASAIGLKKAPEANPIAQEVRDLILASVVHACQDHSQRVRYYATESLFNVVKVMPALAVQHFFIIYEILRSLFADVDLDVKSGAELLDKKLKEVIVGAMNAGSFTADACVPVFARFVYMRNKATKRLTLTWLQELAEKVIGCPILEFLHLFLRGIFDMVADPTLAIRQSALAFLQSVLPKLLAVNNHVVEEAIDDMESLGMKVDFDKILQSLVTTMEHPDPFVRKVAMYWMSRIVKAHIGAKGESAGSRLDEDEFDTKKEDDDDAPELSAATISVRNSLPHVLPGVLLSIGDTFHTKSNVKDTFLPDQTTHALAEQTNACLQDAVRRDGKAYVQHLDSFIVALREELDSPGGMNARNPPATERKPYRMDVKHDGTGIESQGWFRTSNDTKEEDVDSMMMSRLCALHWVIVLYESVVPVSLKADFAREFIKPIIHQLVDEPPEQIIYKSLEVLAKITVPVDGEAMFSRQYGRSPLSRLSSSNPSWANEGSNERDDASFPMTEASAEYALDILAIERRHLKSRDREVFSTFIQLHAHNLYLIGDFSRVIAYMCRLQPPEFVFVSFAVELERFVRRRYEVQEKGDADQPLSRDLQFVASFIQQMCHVLLNRREAKSLRDILKDCIGHRLDSEQDSRRSRLFQILLHSFSHNLVATTSLCLWGGAYRTASSFLRSIDPLDIHLLFLLEVDKLVEVIERPLFRHLHVRMLENDKDPLAEGSGTMLFQTLKSLLMLIPQSTCYNVLRDRLVSTSRFRQSVIVDQSSEEGISLTKETEMFVARVVEVRAIHCKALWETIRAESLETKRKTEAKEEVEMHEEGVGRREWLGYATEEEERVAQARYQEEKRRRQTGFSIEEIRENYNELTSMTTDGDARELLPNDDQDDSWKDFWAQNGSK